MVGVYSAKSQISNNACIGHYYSASCSMFYTYFTHSISLFLFLDNYYHDLHIIIPVPPSSFVDKPMAMGHYRLVVTKNDDVTIFGPAGT